jgi:hypothetical protein
MGILALLRPAATLIGPTQLTWSLLLAQICHKTGALKGSQAELPLQVSPCDSNRGLLAFVLDTGKFELNLLTMTSPLKQKREDCSDSPAQEKQKKSGVLGSIELRHWGNHSECCFSEAEVVPLTVSLLTIEGVVETVLLTLDDLNSQTNTWVS